ncbi:AraC family transcriptional regulator [Dyadobacter sp. CY323]|uniref:AraC family transcriptional regulator n=1 Tax=Dyadobacter sp. CY323 TaxID=2907302 RepID=UPI001F44DBA7|nr:AraC family transcriptional regulator [Dyadobacter sp. CY323]MCE6991847.1 AraC family transcriptional regulator [Dyadobacter sp. CY323]
MKAHFEQVRPLPENSFKVFLHEVDEFDAPWHYHPEFELTLILNSQGVRYVGNNIENFGEGDLVLLGPNLPHCWKNNYNDHKVARAIVIQWQEQFLGAGWVANPEFNHIRRLLQLASQGTRFKQPVSNQIQEMMLRLLDLSPFKKLMQLLEILDLLAEAEEKQLLCEQGFIYPINYEDNQRINLVYNYVRKHYDKKITLNTIASLVHMNEESFSRFFSRIIHKPFFTFLNEYRVNMACKLLIETDMQVAQISYACGYESLPFFYRQFTKFSHMPPLAYRKKFHQTSVRPTD